MFYNKCHCLIDNFKFKGKIIYSVIVIIGFVYLNLTEESKKIFHNILILDAVAYIW